MSKLIDLTVSADTQVTLTVFINYSKLRLFQQPMWSPWYMSNAASWIQVPMQ